MQQAFISHCVNINKLKNYKIFVYIDDLHKDNSISSLDEYIMPFISFYYLTKLQIHLIKLKNF